MVSRINLSTFGLLCCVHKCQKQSESVQETVCACHLGPFV